MQLNIFTGFDADEARRMLREWRADHPRARVVSEQAMPPHEGFGQFEGKQVHQIVVKYEGLERK
jgi:hypothetical protein